MKRTLPILILISLLLAGCTGGSGNGLDPGGGSKTDYSRQVRVMNEYSYTNSIDRELLYLIVQNDSNKTLDISANVKAINTAGQLIGAKTDTEHAIPAGEKTILSFSFDEPFSKIEYVLDASVSRYTPVIQNLSYASQSALDKEIVTVTNNGNVVADFVKAHCLFFDGNELVYYSSSYFTDNDSEIKPGKEITKELKSYSDYDSTMIILTGRGKFNY